MLEPDFGVCAIGFRVAGHVVAAVGLGGVGGGEVRGTGIRGRGEVRRRRVREERRRRRGFIVAAEGTGCGYAVDCFRSGLFVGLDGRFKGVLL